MTRILYQPGNESREVYRTFIPACSMPAGFVVRDRPVDYSARDICPVGDVPFCEAVMAQQGIAIPKPDFYPTWLEHWMHREYCVERNDGVAVIPTFVKSAESYKAWPAKLVKAGERYPEGLICISGLVTFVQEWRYYVADGEVVATGWYDGRDEDEPAPELNILWPAGFCGAVDFGRLDDGKIALVESHHPYACGWYGDDHVAYLNWLISGFEYLSRGCHGK